MKASERPSVPQWELFSHESDMGIRGFGKTAAEAFEQAGMALTAMVTDLSAVSTEQQITIRCQAPELELLFMDWINGIIYEMATRKMLFKHFEVALQGDELQNDLKNDLQLEAVLWGEKIDIEKHQPNVEPKAATFTELKVQTLSKDLWVAQCVVDV